MILLILAWLGAIIANCLIWSVVEWGLTGRVTGFRDSIANICCGACCAVITTWIFHTP